MSGDPYGPDAPGPKPYAVRRPAPDDLANAPFLRRGDVVPDSRFDRGAARAVALADAAEDARRRAAATEAEHGELTRGQRFALAREGLGRVRFTEAAARVAADVRGLEAELAHAVRARAFGAAARCRDELAALTGRALSPLGADGLGHDPHVRVASPPRPPPVTRPWALPPDRAAPDDGSRSTAVDSAAGWVSPREARARAALAARADRAAARLARVRAAGLRLHAGDWLVRFAWALAAHARQRALAAPAPVAVLRPRAAAFDHVPIARPRASAEVEVDLGVASLTVARPHGRPTPAREPVRAARDLAGFVPDATPGTTDHPWVGRVVGHPVWGDGVVHTVEVTPSGARAWVHFEGRGTVRLSPAFVGLR